MVAKPLGSIQQLEQQSANFEQQVVFPLTAINQARGLATQFAGAIRPDAPALPAAGIERDSAHAATARTEPALAQSRRSARRSRATTARLYGTVMPRDRRPQPVRDLVDMTDAEAQAAMKKAVEIDALADLELQAAEQINQQLQTAAPGSAAILEAQTSAWLVRANAYTQSAMAELVRVRSIELANSRGSAQVQRRSYIDAAQQRAARCFSRERISRVLFSAAPEHGAWLGSMAPASFRPSPTSRSRSC